MLTCGFFNSVNGDRKYNAQNMTEYFEGLFSSGVVGNPVTSMQVKQLSTAGMAVQVLAGKAFIDGYWAKNDGAVQLPIEAANVAVPRIDAIVLRLNLNEADRNITFQVITGTASESPVAPAIIRTDSIQDYLLATVYVGAGVTAIYDANITDKRDSTDCGYVTVVGTDGDPTVISTLAHGMYICTGTNDNIALSNLVKNFFSAGNDYAQLEIDVYGDLGISAPASTASSTATWFDFTAASANTKRRVKLNFSHASRISITAVSGKNVFIDCTNANLEIANLQAVLNDCANGSMFSGTSDPTVSDSAFWLNGSGSQTLIGAYRGTFVNCRMSVTNGTGAAYGFSGNGGVLRLTNVETLAYNTTGSSNESVGVHVMANQTNNILLMTNCTCPITARNGYKQNNVVKVNSGYFALTGNTLGKEAALYSTGTGKTEIGTIYYTGGGKTTIDTDATLAMEGIPADAKATGDQLSDLNQAFNKNLSNRKNAFDISQWENGAINATNGNNAGNADRVRSKGFINRFTGKISSTNSAMRFMLFAWDQAGQYVGGYKNGGFTTDASSYSTFNLEDFYNNSDYAGYQYKIVIRLTSGSVQISNLSGVIQTNILTAYTLDSTLTDSEKAANAKATGDAINAVQKNLTDSLLKKAIGAVEFEAGNIRSDDGTNESSSSRIRSKGYFPIFSGILSSSNPLGGFYVQGYENGVFKGEYNGAEIGVGSKQRKVDFEKLINKYPTYQFRVVYLLDSGSATMSNVSELSLTNTIYCSVPAETIRIMFNNIGGFNYGSHTEKMSTADALQKIENYKQFYANYQPDILALEEYPENNSPGDNKNYIDSGNSVDPEVDLYPFIYPQTTNVFSHAIIKSDYEITRYETVGINLDGFTYALRGRLAEIKSQMKRSICVFCTVWDVNGTEANRTAQMQKSIEILSPYEYAVIGVDTNMLSQAEFNSMKTLFENAGYQMANGGFYPLTDTCPGASYKSIDNIFVKGNAKIKSFVVPNVLSDLASDHLPVLSDILFY